MMGIATCFLLFNMHSTHRSCTFMVEAIQKLLEMDPKVKGIVSSGYSNDPVMAEHKKYGFVGMVHKPFEVEELVATLRNVIVENNTSHAAKVKEK